MFKKHVFFLTQKQKENMCCCQKSKRKHVSLFKNRTTKRNICSLKTKQQKKPWFYLFIKNKKEKKTCFYVLFNKNSKDYWMFMLSFFFLFGVRTVKIIVCVMCFVGVELSLLSKISNDYCAYCVFKQRKAFFRFFNKNNVVVCVCLTKHMVYVFCLTKNMFYFVFCLFVS